MLGNENAPAMLYLLDTNTISQAFGSFNPGIFVSFWELLLAQEMSNDPALSAAANRWISKWDRGTEDADPYLIARARASMLPITVVTEESASDNHPGTIPAVCRHFNLDCVNLDEMILRLGWRF